MCAELGVRAIRTNYDGARLLTDDIATPWWEKDITTGHRGERKRRESSVGLLTVGIQLPSSGDACSGDGTLADSAPYSIITNKP